ncbi:NAC domain containing 69-like protein isoform 1 [Hibiscus syriacus]|uniref:NAC domain containing 69-like protein isoform 1 n=1 Tax=Hibiscus syriacus TaxID=106335 RepID=A0A6A2XK85_HIBSY|nr:uncharacterized protein LOC120186280 [Hibiscus syriacus]KAE8662426.1 NAC domain containing 69-like protein isoform 1 [Hibiscus syriacus]
MIIELEIGFRFLPPDEQIISFYLRNKMIDDHITTRHIREVDLLKHEPWELPALSLVRSTYQEWWFFYKLNKISEKKMDRLTNSGFWKSTGADRPVSYGGRQIGTKKTLVFHRGRTPRGVVKTDWVMHEFRANPDFLPHNASNSYVVGYLRKNAAEKTENSVSNVGQTSAHDLPSTGSHDLPPTSVNNGQIMIDEGISFDDLDSPPSDALVDDEQNEWQRQFDNIIEKEMEFMVSLLNNQEHSNVEAEHIYGPDYLRKNAYEKTENLVSNVGQTSARFAASISPVGFTSMEVVRQLQSDSMDYALVLQMQMEDEGIFASDLSPSRGSHDLPPTSVNNGLIMIDEGISFDDLDSPPSDALVDDDLDSPPSDALVDDDLDSIEEEMEFMVSLFNNQEHSNVEAEHIYGPDYWATDSAGDRRDTDPIWDNAWCDELVHMPDGIHHGHSERLNQNRLETGVHHDEILMMDSRVESATVTACEINCLESVKEERPVISRAGKSESKPRSNKLVAQGQTGFVQFQGGKARGHTEFARFQSGKAQGHTEFARFQGGKAVFRDKARESGIHTPVVQPVQNKKSVVQANKSPKMDQDRNAMSVLNSRSERSAGSSRKNPFKFVEMSQLRIKPKPPLVYVTNVIVGSMLFIFVVWGVMFIR